MSETPEKEKLVVPFAERMAYRVEEAAAVIGVSKRTIYKAVAEGRISSKRIGQCVVIPAEALKAWLNQQAAA